MKQQRVFLQPGVLLTASVIAALILWAAASQAYSPVTWTSSAATDKSDDKHKNLDSAKHGKAHAKATDDEETALGPAAPEKVGTPAIRVDRGDISALDLNLGIGSVEGMPKPPFQFKKEDMTGTNPKIKVIDANGVKWNIKFDEEVHAEVAASRLVWACGYMVEESYFVGSGQVSGVTGLKRAKKFLSSNGSFTNGMFEKRPDNIARRKDGWSWGSNPFVGSRELSGLIILAVMLNDWDAKDTNNAVLGMFDNSGTVNEWYTVADWGGTFGKMGSAFSHTKWKPEDFNKQAFIDGVEGSTLRLHYSGKMSGSHNVPLEHAKWFAGVVGQLTDAQIRQALTTAGATAAETNSFAGRLRAKINELKSVTASH